MKEETKKKVKKILKITAGIAITGTLGYLVFKYYSKNKQWIPKGVHIYDTDDRKLICNETRTDKQYIGGKQETISASNQYLRSAVSKVDDITIETSRKIKDMASGKTVIKTNIVDFLVPKAKINGSNSVPTPPKEMHVMDITRICRGQVCEDQHRLNSRSLRNEFTDVSVGIVNGIDRGDISKRELGKAIYNWCKTTVSNENITPSEIP